MSYDSSKVPVYQPITGYNHLWVHYREYHHKLDQWIGHMWMQFLPRDIKWCKILDIGSGDGRMIKYFDDVPYAEYIALDWSQLLLDQIQINSHISVLQGDLESDRDIADHSIDIWLCFFVLGHLADIQHFCIESARVMKSWSTLIIQYHDEPKPYIHHIGADMYKIQTYHHHIDDIVDELHYAWFQTYIHQIVHKGVVTSWLIVCHI